MEDINITAGQCRAARAYLNWSQPDLGNRSGITVDTIVRLEKSAAKPSSRTMRRIVQAFGMAGIAFTGTGGVEPDRNLITIIDGEDANSKIHDDIYYTLAGTGGEVLCAGVSEPGKEAGDVYGRLKAHIDRLEKAGVKERILIRDGDTNLVAPVAWYRSLPEDQFVQAPVQVYGDKIALKDLSGQQIILINHPLFADVFRRIFNVFWNLAAPVSGGADE